MCFYSIEFHSLGNNKNIKKKNRTIVMRRRARGTTRSRMVKFRGEVSGRSGRLPHHRRRLLRHRRRRSTVEFGTWLLLMVKMLLLLWLLLLLLLLMLLLKLVLVLVLVLRVMRVIVHHCKELWCGKNGDLELQRRWRKTLNPKFRSGLRKKDESGAGRKEGEKRKLTTNDGVLT
jgi:hypothetical protein